MQQVLWLVLVILPRAVSLECRIGSNVMDNGQEYVVNYKGICYVQRCQNGEIKVWQIGCAGRDTCFAEDTHFFNSECIYSFCSYEIVNRRWTYKVNEMARFCIDYYQRCRRPQEIFTSYMENHVYENCTCQISGLLIVQYKCSGSPMSET